MIKTLKRRGSGWSWVHINTRGEETLMHSDERGQWVASSGGYIRLSTTPLPQSKAEAKRILEEQWT